LFSRFFNFSLLPVFCSFFANESFLRRIEIEHLGALNKHVYERLVFCTHEKMAKLLLNLITLCCAVMRCEWVSFCCKIFGEIKWNEKVNKKGMFENKFEKKISNRSRSYLHKVLLLGKHQSVETNRRALALCEIILISSSSQLHAKSTDCVSRYMLLRLSRRNNVLSVSYDAKWFSFKKRYFSRFQKLLKLLSGETCKWGGEKFIKCVKTF
jgi:hypothetical protein